MPDDNVQLAQMAEAVPAQDNSSYSILIVEDCDQSRDLMYNLFAGQGFVCHTAENGLVAMDILNANKVDVVLLDIMMPVMNGYQVIKAVKSSVNLLHIPIIAITGNDSPDAAVRCIELGAEDYLNKPFDPLMLKTRVNAHMEKKRLRDIEIDYRRKLEEQNAMLEERVREQVAEIMERWKAEEDLQKAKERAEEETLLRDKFVSLVSHDLRSPLSSVIGLLRLIESNLAASQEESAQTNATMMRRAVNSCNDLIKMIDQLLSISRLKMGSLKPISSFQNARTLVGAAIANMSFLAKEKNITIVNEIAEETRIFVDRQLTLEVLQNLVSNAIKFSESGSTVTVFSPKNSTSVIAVKDSGVGISPDMAVNLFRHDIRTTTTGTHGERGTGLGLPLCKDIMEAHGGSIRLESREAEGSVFYLEFKKIRPLVLLVNDKEEMRYILKSILNKLDTDILEAENGSAAINMLDSVAPHLIVTDLQMPVMDGYKLLRNIRNHPRMGKTPVVVVTSDIDLETRDKAMRMGADEFFTTPVTQDFLPRIGKLVG